jgi:hypothetical protein
MMPARADRKGTWVNPAQAGLRRFAALRVPGPSRVCAASAHTAHRGTHRPTACLTDPSVAHAMAETADAAAAAVLAGLPQAAASPSSGVCAG